MVEFHPGRQNTVAHALSRRDEYSKVVLVLLGPSFTLFDDVRTATADDSKTRGLL